MHLLHYSDDRAFSQNQKHLRATKKKKETKKNGTIPTHRKKSI